MKKLFCIFALVLSGCCFENMKVLLEEPDFHAEKRTLVYEDNSNSSAAKMLRASLRKEGIKVLKYTSANVTSIHEKISNDYLEKNTDIYTSNKISGSPYVIEVSGQIRPDVACLIPWQQTTLYQNISVEITNLNTREVVFSATADGLDSPCGYCSGCIFDKLAKKIAIFWNQSEQTDK